MLRARLKITREDIDHNIKVLIDEPSKSFLLQFPSLLARQWMQASDTCKDTAGQSVANGRCDFPFHMTSYGGYGRAAYIQITDWDVLPNFAADEQGIVIGTDPALVQPDQYAMISQIRSGEIADTVMYFGTVVYGLTIDDVNDEASFKVETLFHNKSGGSINVNECGIYANGYSPNDQYPNLQQYCIIRDKLASTIVLASDERLRVEYTIGIAT
jgi:hypothetical protein